MYFYPRNRYLHVSSVTEEKEDGFKGLLLPEDYKTQSGPLHLVKLVKACEGSSYVSDEGNLLLVPTHVIESLQYQDAKVEIVPENSVYGVMVKV